MSPPAHARDAAGDALRRRRRPRAPAAQQQDEWGHRRDDWGPRQDDGEQDGWAQASQQEDEESPRTLTRRDRLRMERAAQHSRGARVNLRLAAVLVIVAGLISWLAVSWLMSAPSASDQIPDPPAADQDEGPRPPERPGGGAATDAGSAADDQADAQPSTVVVHVAGAVEEAGVVEVPAGSRVLEVIEAAGGARDDAALDALNLAAEAQDGTLISVPTRQEVDSGDFTPQSAPDDGGDSGSAAPIDLNTAAAAELEELPGIGPALSERIVDHREQQGRFGSLEDLAAVSGIGPAILADVEELVTW